MPLQRCYYCGKGKDNSLPHYCALHGRKQTNLVIIMLLKLPLVFHIEAMFQSLNAFFAHSHKNCFEFFKVAKKLASKG